MTEDGAAPVLVEPARSFASVWAVGVVLLVGVGLDALLGGLGAHLIGWAVACVLVLGIQILLVYAARATRSLRVTADELRVGDEAVPRAGIVGVTPGFDRALPVLGWPHANPRAASGVTIRLGDGRDLAVPTRDPQRLQRVLGVADAVPREAPPVRPAQERDLTHLADIDERAEVVFRLAGYELPDVPFDDNDTAAAVFVVGDPPVGFVRVDELDGLAHIAEIAVVPGSMRQGHGRRLLDHACSWAADNGYPAVTLTTYADVPWNGPWYRTCGFVETEAGSPALQAIRAREQDLGLDAVARRVVMRRDLGGDD